MKRWVLFLVMCTLLQACSSSRVGDPEFGHRMTPVPAYTARKAVDTIVIDGIASEATWREAERVGRFVGCNGEEIPDLTDCKLTWDDQALYVLYLCRDDDIQASYRDHDDPLWEEDVVEIFIDADADGKTYAEIIVNPLNTVFDNYLLKDPEGQPEAAIWGWSCTGLQTAVTVDGSVRDPKNGTHKPDDVRWTVEMRIPFSNFVLRQGLPGAPPRDGEVWRMALTRYDRPDPETFIHMAWSPPYRTGWPHVTERFGKVVFAGK